MAELYRKLHCTMGDLNNIYTLNEIAMQVFGDKGFYNLHHIMQ